MTKVLNPHIYINQVTFINLALHIIQITSKQLYSKISVSQVQFVCEFGLQSLMRLYEQQDKETQTPSVNTDHPFSSILSDLHQIIL